MLSNDHVSELWQARKGIVIPPGTTAYYLQSRRRYAAGSRLETRDRHGGLLVCHKQFSLQLRELPVSASSKPPVQKGGV